MPRKTDLSIVPAIATDAQLVATLRREANRLATVFDTDPAEMLDAIVSALPAPMIERAVAALATAEEERTAA